MDNQLVNFPGEYRLHVGLATTDVIAATRFYRSLFGAEPTKQRPGYAKFEPQDPSVNLSLNQVSAVLPRNPESHFGIQVKSFDTFEAARERLVDEGLQLTIARETVCCYAVQDKIWIADPDGNSWELFLVIEADADLRSDSNDCCSDDCCSDGCCERGDQAAPYDVADTECRNGGPTG